MQVLSKPFSLLCYYCNSKSQVLHPKPKTLTTFGILGEMDDFRFLRRTGLLKITTELLCMPLSGLEILP
jgi:hypothetical protein